ncbi:hypothetical protein ERO13_D10G024050v2 [Gossypium hirsutum]|nr:hypothetical protein ERO13_D10G024050v2 [Gossypium hirsutum]
MRRSHIICSIKVDLHKLIRLPIKCSRKPYTGLDYSVQRPRLATLGTPNYIQTEKSGMLILPILILKPGIL